MNDRIEDFFASDPETLKNKEKVDQMVREVEEMDPVSAVEHLHCLESETDFMLRLKIIMRMHNDEQFRAGIVNNFRPPYFIE